MTFTMWSLGHYLFLLSPFVGIILLYQLTKSNDPEKNRRIGLILSMIAVVILLLRNIEIFVSNGYAFDIELIPLQVCHFANIVLLLAFLTKKQSLYNFALILNLPAAFVSILFANSLANYSTILTFRGFAYIFGHFLLVVIPVWAYMIGFIKLNKKTLIETFKIVSILYLASIFVNNLMYLLFGQYANYFYTLKPENGTPLEMFYNWGQTVILSNGFKFNILYLILTALFGLVIMIVLYAGFYVHQKKRQVK
jgi:uncharacterized membrane protein YwaF